MRNERSILSVSVSAEQKVELDNRAGHAGMTVSGYIRSILFDGDAGYDLDAGDAGLVEDDLMGRLGKLEDRVNSQSAVYVLLHQRWDQSEGRIRELEVQAAALWKQREKISDMDAALLYLADFVFDDVIYRLWKLEVDAGFRALAGQGSRGAVFGGGGYDYGVGCTRSRR